MVVNHRIAGSIVLCALILSSACGKEQRTSDSTANQKSYTLGETYHGWDSVMLRNMFVRLDVVPELGGRIMGYDFQGYQVVWHDSASEGVTAVPPASSPDEYWLNPGGVVVGPAPRGTAEGQWPGPVMAMPEMPVYDAESDGSSVTVSRPADESGISHSNTYALRSSGTVVDGHLTMTNESGSPVTLSIGQVVPVSADSASAVVIPSATKGWRVVEGDPDSPQWLGVADGLFTAKYAGESGATGISAGAGWAAWHDAKDDIVFVIQFPLEVDGTYPGDGSSILVRTAKQGSSTSGVMGLEVVSPQRTIAPGATSSFDVTWSVCRCSGVKRVTPAGVVAEELKYENGLLTGRFGVFYSGTLQIVYFDQNGNQRGLKNFMQVSPLNEIVLAQREKDLVETAWSARYQIRALSGEVVGVIGEVKLK